MVPSLNHAYAAEAGISDISRHPDLKHRVLPLRTLTHFRVSWMASG
jgi:hypothetical protein